jgi:hypothetical protein
MFSQIDFGHAAPAQQFEDLVFVKKISGLEQTFPGGFSARDTADGIAVTFIFTEVIRCQRGIALRTAQIRVVKHIQRDPDLCAASCAEYQSCKFSIRRSFAALRAAYFRWKFTSVVFIMKTFSAPRAVKDLFKHGGLFLSIADVADKFFDFVQQFLI